MRHLLLSLALLLAAPKMAAQCPWTGKAADSLFIVNTLRQAKAERASISNTPVYFARKFLGRPYVAHTLEGSDDRRVVVNTRQLDCTTLVENVVALTACLNKGKLTFADFVAELEGMRYHQGKARGYHTRLHYFTEWIVSNTRRGLVSERQSPNPPFTAVQTVSVNYMSRHPSAYDALKANPSLTDSVRQREKAITGMKFRYIPKRLVGNRKVMRRAVSDGDLIAITSGKQGLDIAHLGFALWQSDGLHLLNASMLHKKVVVEPMTLGEYLSKHPSHTGIRVMKILNDKN